MFVLNVLQRFCITKVACAARFGQPKFAEQMLAAAKLRENQK